MEQIDKHKNIRENFNEIFELLRREKSYEKKVEILQTYQSAPLHLFLFLALNPDITFDLPEGDIPADVIGKASPLPEDLQSNKLYAMFGKKTDKGLPAVIKFSPILCNHYKIYRTLPKMKKEELFLAELRGLSAGERQLLIEFKDKKVRGISPDVVIKAYPDSKFHYPLWQYFKFPDSETFAAHLKK